MQRIAVPLFILSILVASPARAQSYFALTGHLFGGAGGQQPAALVTGADGFLYGMTQSGGAGFGSLFRYATDGSFSVLHDFTGNDGSMQIPTFGVHGARAYLVAAPTGDIYGYTVTGGNANCQQGFGCGVLFRYSPTSGFSVLWKFTGGSDGSTPSGLVYASDGNLYGSAIGLPDNDGAVFQVSPAGAFKVLHTFCQQPNCTDGYGPQGITEGPDHKLYGYYEHAVYSMTHDGAITPLVPIIGTANYTGDLAGNFIAGSDGGIYFTFDQDPYGSGHIDRYDIPTNRLRLAYQFDYTDGNPPYRLAAGVDGAIYGTAASGGGHSEGNGSGTAFRLDLPSTLSFLYNFQGALDGGTPMAITQTADGRLFGVDATGGISAGSGCTGCGTVFQLASVSPAAPVIGTFDPASGPAGTTVTLSGSQFTGTVALQFGTTASAFSALGDTSLTTTVPSGLPQFSQFAVTSGAGAGYDLEPFELSAWRLSTLYRFCAGSSFPQCGDGAGPANLIQSVDGNFYGTTTFNFPSSVLFKVTPAGTESVIAQGLNIPNPILESGSYFYGTSQYGGYYGLATGCNSPENPTGCGTVFKVNRSTGHLTTLYKFKGLTDGAFPQGNVVTTGAGVFYGTTGATLWRLRGITLTTVHNFSAATDGNQPSVIVAGRDGNIYGANVAGGSSDLGTIFEFMPGSSTYQVLHSFSPGEGAKPVSLVRAADGTLYGATLGGGATGNGTLFRIDASGHFSALYAFSPADPLGSGPTRLILGKDGALYGLTTAGALLGGGAAFRLNADGSQPTTMYAFFPSGTGSSHGYAPTALLQGRDGDWYGTTYNGGALDCQYGEGCGTVFHLR